MSLYEMSKIEKYTQMEEYKGAFKDAMKFCSKYGAKDKDKKYVDEFPDFFMNIRKDITIEGDVDKVLCILSGLGSLTNLFIKALGEEALTHFSNVLRPC